MHRHNWMVFSTLRMQENEFLMVHCACGDVGTVGSPSGDEWRKALQVLPGTYPWEQGERVNLFPGVTTGWNEESKAWVIVRG